MESDTFFDKNSGKTDAALNAFLIEDNTHAFLKDLYDIYKGIGKKSSQ